MTHVVCEPCFACKYTDCVVVCPVECFYEGDYIIQPRVGRQRRPTLGPPPRAKTLR